MHEVTNVTVPLTPDLTVSDVQVATTDAEILTVCTNTCMQSNP